MSDNQLNILAETDTIVSYNGKEKDSVITILQAVQSKFNYLPQAALKRICETTLITPAEINGVATFYSQFRFEPAGKHIIKVCAGTACHVKGAMLVHDALARHLKLSGGHMTDDKGLFTLSTVSCLGCCTLAPAVQIDDITYGHVSPNKSSVILNDFLGRDTSIKTRSELVTATGEIQGEIRVGLGSCCVASGSSDIRQAIDKSVIKNKLNLTIKDVGCVGMCHQVPLVEVITNDKGNSRSDLYAKVTPHEVKRIINHHFNPPGLLRRLGNTITASAESILSDANPDGIERYAINIREKHVAAFIGNQIPIATEYRGAISPLDIDEYISNGGFKGLEKALTLTSDEIIDEILNSGLRGRGGAGFPTGIKWKTIAARTEDSKILICNGDEGDPGAFMDRMLLESYPFRIIEGMIIAARAVGSHEGIFYIRAEYPLAVKRIKQAIEICTERGFLGENILSGGHNLKIRVKEGAGAFVCGEETALIASIEGKRGFPKLRPPYPAEKGLWDKPTLVNNTETFAMVPYILMHGSKNFSSIGTGKSKGTKVFALAGKINRGGLIEVPMGISIREIVEDVGGGIANGKKFKALQIGGPSGGCVPHYLSETAVDFESLQAVGAMMGSGGLVVLDETDCMVDMARYFLSFTQTESCGKCTFCRVGTRRMLNIMDRLCSGKSKKDDLDELENLGEWIKKGSLCGLGKTAPNPVLSTLRYFRNEYEAHLEGRCPTGKCKELISYYVNDNCIGCTICAQQCPVDAIPFAPHSKHEIDQELCTRCDICRQACPAEAISTK